MRIYSYVMIADNGFAPNPYHGICTLACCKPKIRRGVANYVVDSFIVKIKEDNKNIKKLTSKKKKELGLPEVINLQAVKGYFKDTFQDFVKGLQIWIVGTAGKDLKSNNPIVYIMQVTDIETYKEYWDNHKEKQPDSDYFTQHSSTDKVKNLSYKYCGDNIYEVNSESECIRQLPSFHYFKDEYDTDTVIHDLSGMYVLLSDNFVYFGNKAVNFEGEIHNGKGHRIFVDNEKLEKFIENQISKNKNDIKGRPINSDEKFDGERK